MTYEPYTRKGAQQLFYKSGIIRSHRQMTYGYYEARIKGCRLFPGACLAFWAYSNGRQTSGVHAPARFATARSTLSSYR